MSQSHLQPEVIHEDNHILVIDKPPGLATMGAREGEDSLVNWTRSWLKKKYNKPGNVYLGVVSRLDAFTTGLIVLARTSKAAGRLTRQFQAGEVEKMYTAILEQRPPELQGHLVDRVIKNDQRRRMVVVEEGSGASGLPGAKRAELRYRVTGFHGSLTLVEIQLLTGRKHQIRVQFSTRGMPILGDRKYDATGSFFSRAIALQASSLSFEHPVRRERMSFRIEPPARWKLGRFTGF